MKKIMLLATMAVAAVAFAAPASASAAWHFTHKHEPIGKETTTVELTGKIAFSSATGKVECEAHPTLSVGTADATLTNLNITTSTCKYEEAFAHCELTKHELTPEVTVTPVGKDQVTIDNFKLTNVFGTAAGESETPCAVAGLPLELTFSSISLEAETNKTETITGFKVTGSAGGVLDIEPGTPIAGITASGTLTVAGEPTLTISEVETP